MDIEAPVDPVLGLGEIEMGVLGKVEGMVGAGYGALEVAQEDIDRVKLRQPGARIAAAGD